MIEFRDVVKHYGPTKAVDGVSFTAPSGAVTGFLGPNGAGKTTTLRVLLGLARADQGTALIDGVAYVDLPTPRRTVGAVIDDMGFHPGRTGRDHLRVIARAASITPSRVDEVLDFVDLTAAAERRAGGYSQGMRQRLALASALLGDPEVLVLDEPGNGLDPAGLAWLRKLLADWAAEGRTVLFSSHVLAEVQLVADKVVIISRGRVVRDESVADMRRDASAVVVRTADVERLSTVGIDAGWEVRPDGPDRLIIHGASPTEVGQAAARASIVLAELSSEAPARQLEDLFLDLTASSPEVAS